MKSIFHHRNVLGHPKSFPSASDSPSVPYCRQHPPRCASQHRSDCYSLMYLRCHPCLPSARPPPCKPAVHLNSPACCCMQPKQSTPATLPPELQLTFFF